MLVIATIKRLFTHSALYGLGSVLNRLIGFILLPLYTRYLTPVDYGISSLLLTTNSVAVIMANLGIGSALFREVIYKGRDEGEVESTALYFLIGEGFLFFGALILFADQISNLVFGPDSQTYLLRLTFLTGFLQMIQTVFMARLRIREKSANYSIISISRFVVGTGLNIYYVAVRQLGVEGLVLASLITTAIFGAIYLVILIRQLRFNFSFPALWSMLRFGAPLIPGNIASMVMTSADRYFLQHYSTTAEVGLYSLGYKIGLVMNMIVQAVQLAWPAQKFEIMKEADAERKFSRIFTIYIAGLGFISLGFSVLAREMLVVMTTPDFYSASSVIPLILLSYLLYGARFMTNIGLTRENKMEYASMVIFGTAILNLGLNFWLIPRYGMIGAAWSTFISYGTLAVLNLMVNQRFWHIPYEYLRILKLGIVWVLIYYTSVQITNPNVILSIIIKLFLLACFPILLFVLRFFKPEELKKISQIVQARTKNIKLPW
jgi:O-antigen/teichoic acid export membrane protein